MSRGKLGKIVEEQENFAQKEKKRETSPRKRSRARRQIGQNHCETREFCPKGEEKQIHKVSFPLIPKIVMN
ncbi:hypothetical protein DWX65_09265 [Roseburia sp. AF20-18LB]|nr:hypothetical protein DWX65_09265 [Roseburia sp. AF20-18LB]